VTSPVIRVVNRMPRPLPAGVNLVKRLHPYDAAAAPVKSCRGLFTRRDANVTVQNDGGVTEPMISASSSVALHHQCGTEES
jgi:hypothetical protein